MAHDVFISYSHTNKAIADAICANIENAAVRCWIAPRDIAPGMDWPTAILNAIVASRVMVLVFSAESNRSKQVGNEISLAFDNNLVIIPFRIDNIPPEPGKQYYLSRTHWLDAMNPPTQEQINKLVSHVKLFLMDQEAIGTIAPVTEAKRSPTEIVAPSTLVTTPSPQFVKPEPASSKKYMGGSACARAHRR
jgi:hypothetical protein